MTFQWRGESGRWHVLMGAWKSCLQDARWGSRFGERQVRQLANCFIRNWRLDFFLNHTYGISVKVHERDLFFGGHPASSRVDVHCHGFQKSEAVQLVLESDSGWFIKVSLVATAAGGNNLGRSQHWEAVIASAVFKVKHHQVFFEDIVQHRSPQALAVPSTKVPLQFGVMLRGKIRISVSKLRSERCRALPRVMP